ncbi:siderophore-interacting protein [Luteimonas terrae]|uniref:NADPH-dependent ferric siderophore reductase n=1 Tax=Luteimonas terrae TaxID=1530191 RepID=A0ABU1XYD8_9GAMM|nr:siderophore-interacting protein [Luteimonas terrae]MDR7193801.1 NADPH-dependent ferric siderophore reductase [Luteimonas terrae]
MSRASYRKFSLHVCRRTALSPSFVRITLHDTSVAAMTTHAPDQRVKLFFPLQDGAMPALPDGDDWYARYREMPAGTRPPMRTYTIRALRPAQCEVDVDFVLHGDGGPASAWATRANVGDPLLMLAPDAAFDGTPDGFEWRPSAGLRQVLLAGDKTALPAIAGILEALAAQPDPPRVVALLEIPEDADRLELRAPRDAALHWLPRATSGAAHGARLQSALRLLMPAAPSPDVHASDAHAEIDLDMEILGMRSAAGDHGFQAWIACESGAAMAMRRHLTTALGIDKRAVACMGYWRLGRAQD